MSEPDESPAPIAEVRRGVRALPEVVGRLEVLLEQARAGKVIGFAFVGISPDPAMHPVSVVAADLGDRLILKARLGVVQTQMELDYLRSLAPAKPPE